MLNIGKWILSVIIVWKSHVISFSSKFPNLVRQLVVITSFEWNDELALTFIDEFKKQRCLGDSKDTDRKSKNKNKNYGYHNLSAQFKKPKEGIKKKDKPFNPKLSRILMKNKNSKSDWCWKKGCIQAIVVCMLLLYLWKIYMLVLKSETWPKCTISG
jgi:hypothetical protein